MNLKPSLLRWSVPALLLVVASCQDMPAPTAVPDQAEAPANAMAPQEIRGQAPDVVSEMMALPQTVFGHFDDDAGQFVFGVEHAGVARGIQTAMTRRGIPASSYRVRVTEPIRFMSNLRDAHATRIGGLQIHFSNYLCTLGFNVDHAGGRSFVTNSHCTAQQGSIDGVAYYQPSSSVDGTPIAFEVDDPAYGKLPGCSRGKKCRYSDAARALYQTGVLTAPQIAKTTGENSGSLVTAGEFAIAAADETTTNFSNGLTVHKVGRTTGWTSGDVVESCSTVNVSGSNIQLLCQTLVENTQAAIVGSGDSGSPVFTESGGNATLIGILWGGGGSSLFVFSPLKNIQDELGAMDPLLGGDLGGGDGGGGGGGGDGGTDEPNCPPNSNSPKCRE